MENINDPLFKEGADAFYEGAEYEDCPYAEGTDGEFGWKRGWTYCDHREGAHLNWLKTRELEGK